MGAPSPAPATPSDAPVVASTTSSQVSASEGSRGPPLAPRARPWTVTVVVLIVGLLLLAGVAYWRTNSTPTSGVGAPPGWSSFRGAALLAQQLVDGRAGGPWQLNFADGLASNGAFAPMITGSNGASTDCLAPLSGVSVYTYWNYSLYPRLTSSAVFSSGTAPLWTLGFLGPSGATSVVSVLNGTATWNGQFPATSLCVHGNSSRWPASLTASSLIDSPEVAAAEAPLMETGAGPRALPNLWLDPTKDGPTYEMYVLGLRSSPVSASDFSTGSGDPQPQWYAIWGSCGVPGAPPTGPVTGVGFNSTTGAWGGLSFSGRASCRTVQQSGQLGPPTNGTLPNGTARTVRWGMTIDPPVTSWVPPAANWSVLPLGTVTVTLNLSDGTRSFAPGASTCGVGTATISQCTVSLGGWFVVLTDSAGDWLDSYPTVAGGRSWSLPGIVPVTGDSLEVIVPMEHPSGWVLTMAGVQGSILGSANVYG